MKADYSLLKASTVSPFLQQQRDRWRKSNERERNQIKK